MRRSAPLVVLVALVAACSTGSGESSTTSDAPTSSEPPTSISTTVPTTTTTIQAPTTTAPATTTSSAALPGTGAVVLVTADDVLNVRDTPLGEIEGTLQPTATGITLTGATSVEPSGTWLEVTTPQITGWVNGQYLTPEIPDADFASATEPADLAADLLTWAQTGSGPAWSGIVGPKGLTVIHFDTPKHWPPGQNPFLDPTVFGWGGEALEAGEFVANETFADQIGPSFAGVAADPDVQLAIDQPLQGPESAPPYLPVPFQSLHYLAFHDPGDDASYDGLDWTTWYLHFEPVGGGWAIVGMSVDRWAP
jgi:hypothetical protein